MRAAEKRHDEAATLAALDALQVMDSAPDPEFDAVVQAAALLCGVPIAVIGLIDAHRQWFKAQVGLPGATQTPRDLTFCGHTVLSDELLIVPDATQDERFADNPAVTEDPNVRFYAGAPLVVSGGHRVGTLCLIDRQPRQLTSDQQEALSCLAAVAASALEGRRARLLAEHAARESARAAFVQQHSADAIIGLAPDFTIVRWNPAAERLLGHAAQAIVGSTVERLVRPEDLPAHRDACVRLADRQAQLRDTVFRHRDGSDIAVAITLVPEFDTLGAPLGATLFARDDRPHQRALAKVAASELHMRHLYESTPAMLHAIDLEGRLTMVSDVWLARLGYARDDVLGRRIIEFLTPVSREHKQTIALPILMREGRYDELEIQMCCRSGEVIDVLLSAIVEHDLEGKPLRVLTGLQDITARRKVENELSDARQRELKVGAQIQQALLVTASPPAMDGLQFASHSQASQGIDGDFVEIIRVGEHCVDLITGDVMGKGMGAAMLGAATKLQFSRSIAELVTQTAASQPLPGPAEVVAAVHRAMTPTLQQLEAFVTLCYLRIDTLHNTVTWVGCGHEETLLLAAGGAQIVLSNQHPPLGVLEAVDYVQDATPLAAGDALFLCSDGVTDALRSDGERVGRERLVAALAERDRHHVTPAALLNSLRRDLLPTGTQLVDDLTMVVVQREPMGASQGRIELPLELQALRQVRGFVASRAAAAGLDEVQAGLLESASVEVFTNIVRHGESLLEQAPLELLARRTERSLMIELVHLGDPFTPPVDPPEADFDAYPEGGFGLQFIRSACDLVEYLHVEGVNTIRITKHLNAASSAGPSSTTPATLG